MAAPFQIIPATPDETDEILGLEQRATRTPDALERPKEFSGAEGRKQVLLAAKKDQPKEK